MTLRAYYDEKLQKIRTEIVRMANLSSEMIERAVEAATSGNPARADSVIERDAVVDDLEEQVIREALTIMAREAPVAQDLRLLTSTLGVIGEIEKVADDAVKLARRSKQLGNRFPGELRAPLLEMGQMARKALAVAIKLYAEYEIDLASELIESDEQIDTQYSIACSQIVVLMRQDPQRIEDLLATMQIFHALEHIADRSVAVVKRLRMHYEAGPSTSVLGS
ncbi:MAG: hypothetical protein JST40_02580 [Armatimonadetes bacterium]|nr:hypothetical protein [Armatimonadota bacterium]